jgi:hypothetical protein
MASYTITTTKYITELTLKTGSDTYNVDAGTLIIDSDTRYGPNTTPTTGPLGNLTVSSTLGGLFQVTTEFTKLVSFIGNVGTIPAAGTVITQGSASGVLLCVMSDRTGGTVYSTGDAVPPNGWMKLRVTAGTFVAGSAVSGIAVTGITDQEQGWIHLVGVKDRVHSHSRLGSMSMRGDWFSVGQTNGIRGQTMQLPHFTAATRTDYPGVEIETAPGSGVYDFWPNAGLYATSVNCSTDSRSRFVYISTAGVVMLGLGNDASVCNDLPVSGCKVRIPSIILQECDVTNLQTNVEPWRSMGNRYESAFTNAGLCDIRKVTGTWYWNILQAYSLYIRDVHVCDNILIGEVATQIDVDNLHQGLSTATTEFASNGIVFQQCYYGGVIGTMSWLRGRASATSGYAAIIVNCYGGWNINKLRGGHTGAATAVSGAIYLNTNGPMIINEIWTFTKRVLVQAAAGLKINTHYYADNCVGTTPTTIGARAVESVAMTQNLVIENIKNWPGVANCHPYLGLFFANTTQNSSLRFCGTPAEPFNAGTVNLMAYIFDDGGNNADIMIQRNWTTALRLGLHGGTNTTNRFTSVNNYMTDASKTIGPQQQNSEVHGNRFNSGGVPTSYSAVYGNCMWDGFTGDNTTRAALILVEKNATNPDAYQVTYGLPRFTGAGRLAMLLVGDQVEWTWPWKILGWSGLTSFARQGQNVANMTYEYDLDKGNGWGGWKTCSNANLLAETGLDPVDGFRLRIRITCIVASTTNRIDSFNIDGATALALQNAALYPLPVSGFKIVGFPAGSDIVIYDDLIPADGTGANVLATGDNVSNEWTFTYSGFPTITIGVFRPEYVPAYFRGITMTGIDSEYKVQLFRDRNYI